MTGIGGSTINLEARVFVSENGYSFKGTTSLNGREYEMIAEPIQNHRGEFIGSIAVALAVGRLGGSETKTT